MSKLNVQTVESLTHTKVPSLAISFSPIQWYVLGQSSFFNKKKDKRNDKLFGYGVKNISLFNVQTLYLLVRVLF